MIERTLFQKLEKRIDYKKALILLDPGQTGKTTLTKAFAAKLQQLFEYFNGDSTITRSLWKVDQIAALQQRFGSKKLVIIDVAQQLEQVGLICKQLIDAGPGPAQNIQKIN